MTDRSELAKKLRTNAVFLRTLYPEIAQCDEQAAAALEAPADVDQEIKSLRGCVIADNNYAVGMSAGWNLCAIGKTAEFNRIREERTRAAWQARAALSALNASAVDVAALKAENERLREPKNGKRNP